MWSELTKEREKRKEKRGSEEDDGGAAYIYIFIGKKVRGYKFGGC